MESTEGGRSDSMNSLGLVPNDGSIDELSAKFSVQGTSNSKGSGKKKVVSRLPQSIFTFFLYCGSFLNFYLLSDFREF